jgi:DNA-binding NtrC family response regulator
MTSAGETILILEEDLQVQWILRTFLESKGHTSVALDKVEKIPEAVKDRHFTVFITTEYWTNPSGLLKAIKELKKAFPGIYILLTTYRTMDENEYETFFQAGVDDFLEKPFSLKKIPILLNKRLRKDWCAKEIGPQTEALWPERNGEGHSGFSSMISLNKVTSGGE